MKILIPYTHDFSKGKDVDQEEVDGWIKEAVRFLVNHPNTNNYGASTGNAMIIAQRGENKEIVVYEFRDYKEHTFYLNESQED